MIIKTVVECIWLNIKRCCINCLKTCNILEAVICSWNIWRKYDMLYICAILETYILKMRWVMQVYSIVNGDTSVIFNTNLTMCTICYRYTLRINLYIRMVVILCNCNSSKLRAIIYIYCFKTLQRYSLNRIVTRKSKATATLNTA